MFHEFKASPMLVKQTNNNKTDVFAPQRVYRPLRSHGRYDNKLSQVRHPNKLTWASGGGGGWWWVMGVAHRRGSACATRYACVRHPVFDTTTCCRVEVYRDMHIITISEMTNALRM